MFVLFLLRLTKPLPQRKTKTYSRTYTHTNTHRTVWLMVAISHETSLCLSLANYCLLLCVILLGVVRMSTHFLLYFSDRVRSSALVCLAAPIIALWSVHMVWRKLFLADSDAARPAIIVMYGKRTNWPASSQRIRANSWLNGVLFGEILYRKKIE